jgi:hypothetical protein
MVIVLVAGATGGCGPVDDDGPGGADCSNPTTLTKEDLGGNTTLEAGCYQFDDKLKLESGTLTLEPGVNIEFGEGADLQFFDDARFVASGTADNPIVLTGQQEQRGYWAGLRFDGSNFDDNVLEHVTLEYAGADSRRPPSRQAGILLEDESQLTIDNSTFVESARTAILARRFSTVEISNSTFESNEAPMVVGANTVGKLGEGNTFEGNDTNAIGVDASSGSAVEEAATWRNQGVPYVIGKNTNVKASLTIEPATRLVFEQGVHFDVEPGGSLKADASEGESITFTGREEVPGFWKGIQFQSLSDDNVFDNVVVEYGGGDRPGGNEKYANVILSGSLDDESRASIANSTIRGSGKHGIRLTGNNSELASCTNVTFENNEGYDVSVDDGNDQEAVDAKCN